MLISMEICEEEDNITIGSDILFLIYTDIPRTRFGKNKYYASEDEVDLELASELSSDERGYAEVL